MAKYRTKEEILRDIKLKKANDLLGLFGNKKLMEFNFNGATIKLNQDKYKMELNPTFKSWYDKHKDDELHIVRDKKNKDMYTLADDDRFLFHEAMFLSKCPDCGEYTDHNMYVCSHCGYEYLELREGEQ